MRILFLLIGCFFSVASNAQLDSKGMDQYDLTNRINRVAYDEPQWVEKAPGTKASIKIFPAQIKGKINPLLIGYNIEDINCAFYP